MISHPSNGSSVQGNKEPVISQVSAGACPAWMIAHPLRPLASSVPQPCGWSYLHHVPASWRNQGRWRRGTPATDDCSSFEWLLPFNGILGVLRYRKRIEFPNT
ncbi:MAG TPA: hypothetical protein VFD13_08290 [Candidatus Kapabacteria bacterium]|nr:hypothetical protein [Candidatus Kapabacteria bacterium]